MKVAAVIWAIVRGLLWALADEFPLGGRKAPTTERKERPWWAEQPTRESPQAGPTDKAEADNAASDRPVAPTWWAESTAPSAPPTIKVETDQGSFISRTTFSGEHAMGVQRVERPRREGESRRRRRTDRPATNGIDPSLAPIGSMEPSSLEPAVPVDPTELTAHELAVPGETVPVEPRTLPAVNPAACGESVLIDPDEMPRVARARRVRGRLAPSGTSGSLLATTLATRLALTTATQNAPPVETAAREGLSS